MTDPVEAISIGSITVRADRALWVSCPNQRYARCIVVNNNDNIASISHKAVRVHGYALGRVKGYEMTCGIISSGIVQ